MNKFKGIDNRWKRSGVNEFTPHFLFPAPIVSISKLLRASSRPPLEVAVRVKEDDFDSKPGCTLWVEDKRPPEPSRFDLFSANSAEELGRLLDKIALFEALLVLETKPLSVSTCCYGKKEKLNKSALSSKEFLKKIIIQIIYLGQTHKHIHTDICMCIHILHTELNL